MPSVKQKSEILKARANSHIQSASEQFRDMQETAGVLARITQDLVGLSTSALSGIVGAALGALGGIFLFANTPINAFSLFYVPFMSAGGTSLGILISRLAQSILDNQAAPRQVEVSTALLSVQPSTTPPVQVLDRKPALLEQGNERQQIEELKEQVEQMATIMQKLQAKPGEVAISPSK